MERDGTGSARTAGRRGTWRRWLAALLLSAAVGPGVAAAQPGANPHGSLAAPGEIADVPVGVGTIRGRVTHRTRSDAVAGLPIALFALGPGGRPGTRQAVTGPGGEFVFANVSNDPSTVYLLAVQNSELPFGARVTFEAGGTERSAEIEIADTSADAAALTAGGVGLRLDRGCGGVRVTETHLLRNPSDFVWMVPADERATRPPLLTLQLPSGAAFVTPGRNLADEGLEQRGDEVVFWGPLYPGTHAIELGYSLTGDGTELTVERRFTHAVEEVAVMAWAEGPAVRGEGLRSDGEVEIDGIVYAVSKTEAIAAGGAVAFALDLAAVSPDAANISVRAATFWLELDDAALDVREQYAFEVAGSAPLRSRSDAPLLCLPLPTGSEGLRFSAEAFAMGIQPDATGGLALRGPIPAGRSEFAVSYLLRSDGGDVRFARTFPTAVPLLSVYIADTGLRVTTDRLHRRRPVRTPDRTHIHLEAFQIEAGETVTLDLAATPPRQPLPRVAAIGFVAAAALLSAAFLTAPLRRPYAQPVESGEDGGGESRAAIYAAIRDLEDDFETGKVSAEDHAAMLRELRGRAAELVRRERSAEAAVAPPARAATAPYCPHCGAQVGPDARFCSQCGGALAAADPGSRG